MTNELIKAMYEYHSTWLDCLNAALGYAFVLGFIYIWRTTRKK